VSKFDPNYQRNVQQQISPISGSASATMSSPFVRTATTSATSTNKHRVSEREDDDDFGRAPTRPRSENNANRDSIRSLLADTSYIFVDDSSVYTQGNAIDAMRAMLEKNRFWPDHIRADDAGYY
jgi:hypothetical protein